MTKLGKYCRAFQLSQFRQFAGWSERSENARRVTKEVNGEMVEVARELTDANYVYLHTNFTVTDGIFIDENVIFSDVTPEWVEFCRKVLGQDSSNNDSEDHVNGV